MQSKPRKQCKTKQEKVKQASKQASKIASKAKQIEQVTELSTPTSNYDSPRMLVVVVTPGTRVPTTVQKLIVVVTVTVVLYTNYDCTVKLFMVMMMMMVKEGRKKSFKIVQNRIC